MSVAVVVDSASSLPADLAAARGIRIVPMTVIVDGEPIHDDAITTDAMLAAMDRSEVSTSGPNPGEFAVAIEDALGTADQVVVLTLSREMSSTHEAAELAAHQVGDRVRVVDTRTAAGAEGLVVLAAARRAAGGGTAEEVEATARDVMARVRLLATVGDLDHLVRSGRVPNLVGSTARVLHVNPLFEFRNGEAHSLHPAIGAPAARHRIVQACLNSRPRDTDARLHVAALAAGAVTPARVLLDDVLAEAPDAEHFVGSFGPVMVVHVGPHLSGLAWWWEPT